MQIFWDDTMRNFSIMHSLGSRNGLGFFSMSVEKKLEILLRFMHKKYIHKNPINFLRYQISERKHQPEIRTDIFSINFPLNIGNIFLVNIFFYSVFTLKKNTFYFSGKIKLSNYHHFKNCFRVGKLLRKFVYNLEIFELQDKFSFIYSQYYHTLEKSSLYLCVIRQ